MSFRLITQLEYEITNHLIANVRPVNLPRWSFSDFWLAVGTSGLSITSW